VALTLALAEGNELLPEARAIGCPLALTRTYHSRASFLAAIPRIPAAVQALAEAARGTDVVVSGMAHLWTPFVVHRLPAPYVPVVHDVRPHRGDPSLLWPWRLRAELSAARAVVALSGGVAAALEARVPHLPCLRMRLPALPMRPPPAVQAEPPCFLLFGRLRAYKGLDLLRDAFALLREAHPEVRLRVVGEGDPEGCAPGLSRLPGVTVEPGWVAEADIPHVLGAATAVVLPYTEASQSGIVPQALALGVPVVATPVGGLPEQAREGAGAILAEAATPHALARAMARVLEPGALPALREAARVAGVAAQDWDGEVARLLSGLRPLLMPAAARFDP